MRTNYTIECILLVYWLKVTLSLSSVQNNRYINDLIGTFRYRTRAMLRFSTPRMPQAS